MRWVCCVTNGKLTPSIIQLRRIILSWWHLLSRLGSECLFILVILCSSLPFVPPNNPKNTSAPNSLPALTRSVNSEMLQLWGGIVSIYDVDVILSTNFITVRLWVWATTTVKFNLPLSPSSLPLSPSFSQE